MDKSHILWQQSSVTLKASLGESEVSAAVSSVSIDKGNQHFDLKLEPRPSGITAIALSADESYLAIEASYHLGIPLTFVVDLKDGTLISLVDRLKKSNVEQADITTTFAWSPEGNKLTFSCGKDASLWLCTYDIDQEKFSRVPTDRDFNGYISMACIMWSNDGQSVSYISEYPSDHMKMYRYNPVDRSVMRMKDLSRAELDKFQKFSPYILGSQQ
ncbi:hypothetical protein MUG84_15690 [Paenibacillus sp. KQZ6P-2]|uniref:Dipeptidylpeptidase IV N-terminal domain-containing protein n=1 Tax=Paenibacillus mangrovi TaxID=2931978 RepID=A0A9X1WWB3_9BACL|nr:hypothetical protein [Paenibacillus mangrovi]MCJ8013174.1 hypothetical protein [Paenibacillus mangrovi]